MEKVVIGLLLFSLLISSCSEDIEKVDDSGILFGVVSDLETGEPVSKVSVQLYEGLAWDCLGASVGRTFTGTDGYYQINEINPNESYFIIFNHTEYKSAGQRVKFVAGKKTELNMTMVK